LSFNVQYSINQSCGSGRFFFTGSGPEFRKRQDPDPIPDPIPDPDPDLNKFLAYYSVEIFLMKLCSKKNINRPKSLTTEIPEVFVAFKYTTKKLRYGHLLKPGSGSVLRRPDPDPQHWF
jgi:hypothetical protein